MIIMKCGGTVGGRVDGGAIAKMMVDEKKSIFSINYKNQLLHHINHIRDSIVASISACHADDRGSIPRRGDYCGGVAQMVERALSMR